MAFAAARMIKEKKDQAEKDQRLKRNKEVIGNEIQKEKVIIIHLFEVK